MRASCWCSFDSDRCSSRCVRTIRWHCAERATGLTRPSSSGPRSATAAISATADSISESPSSPTRGRARISYRRSHWLGWRLSPAPRHLQRFRSVSRPDVERGSGWTFTRGPGSPPCPARDDRVTLRHYASQAQRFGTPRHVYGHAWPSPCTVGTENKRRRLCQTEDCSPWCSR